MTNEEAEEHDMVERKYYAVSEKMARFANDANSMRSYSAGSATNEYKHYVDLVYYYVDRIAEEKPNLLEKAEWMAERYSRKLAEYYNAYYRNEAVVLPSWYLEPVTSR